MLGAGMMDRRAVLQGEAGPDRWKPVAMLVLHALGVPDAMEVAPRPFDLAER